MFKRRPGRVLCLAFALLYLGACAGSDEEIAACTPLLQLETDEYIHWLNAGCYLSWEHESGILQATKSDGYAQVFISPLLMESLKNNAESHPVGAAAVRVMYLTDEDPLRGYSISLKTQNGPIDNWFWYEHFLDKETPSTAHNDVQACTGCHSQGMDFVQSTLPLR